MSATDKDTWNPGHEQPPTGWRDGWLLALIVVGYCLWRIFSHP